MLIFIYFFRLVLEKWYEEMLSAWNKTSKTWLHRVPLVVELGGERSPDWQSMDVQVSQDRRQSGTLTHKHSLVEQMPEIQIDLQQMLYEWEDR